MGKASSPKEVDGNTIEVEDEKIVIKLALPIDLYSKYKELAESQQVEVADLALSRLTRCLNHSSIRSLYLSESQLRQLEQTVQKRPIETAEQALSIISSAFTFRIGEFDPVPITPNQAKRIYLGAIGGQSPHDRLCWIVQGAIAKATGG